MFKRIVVLVVVLAFAATGVFFWYWNNKLTQPDTVTASASVSEEDTASEEVSTEATVEVNMGTGGGVIPLDENGDYVGGAGEDTASESAPESTETPSEPESVSEEPTPSASSTAESSTATQSQTTNTTGSTTAADRTAGRHYNSFDEIDTSTLRVGQGVLVDGKEYIWMDDMADNDTGFMECSPGGKSITLDGTLSGNIIGH
jgi:hypothetical protein